MFPHWVSKMLLCFRNIVVPCLFFMVVVLSVALPGCGKSTKADLVDPTLARSTLESVLESWRRGDPIDSWQINDAPIVVQDLDWKAGVKLASFEILDQGDAVDANLFCQVELSLIDSRSKSFTRNVTYIVGTSPVPTVFRSLTP